MFAIPDYGAAVLEAMGIGLLVVGLVTGLVVALLFIMNALRGSSRPKSLEVAFAVVVMLLGAGGWLSHNFLPLSAAVILAVTGIFGAENYAKRRRRRIARRRV